MREMYNAGHFFEMATAHNQLTGDDKVLNAAVPYYSWANREKGAMTVWLDDATPVSKPAAAKR